MPGYFELRASLNGIIGSLLATKQNINGAPIQAAASISNSKAKIDSIRTDQKAFLDAINQSAIDNPKSTLFQSLLEESQQVLSDLDDLSSRCDTAQKYLAAIPSA